MKRTITHTPAPWKVLRGDWSEDGNARYELEGVSSISAADAYLIAAAPDLLEAVETLLDCFVNDPLGWMDSSDIAIEKAYDAIHKAKGE